MWGASIAERKKALRAAALSQRNSLSQAESRSRSRSIQAKALELSDYLASRSVALYSPVRNEVCTDAIREHALNERKKVFYPRVGQENSVAFIRVHSVTELKIGRFGIREPTGATQLSEAEYRGLVAFVPGLAFDAQGNRLGRGQGWYDRLLKQLGEKTTFVALAYEFQIVDIVPIEAWDRNVHYVITEKRVIDCAATRSQSSQFC